MDINEAAVAVEGLVNGFADKAGKKAREVRVRPSGDDAQAIKVWVDLGPGVSETACATWATELKASIGKAAAGYTLEVRVESL
jgi:hypothetical protein